MKWLSGCLLALFTIGGTYSSVGAGPVTLGNDTNNYFCFGAGGGTIGNPGSGSMPVTITNNCGQPSSQIVKGPATSTNPVTNGHYELGFINNPAFSLTLASTTQTLSGSASQPTASAGTSIFNVVPSTAQFTFKYLNDSSDAGADAVYISGKLQFTQFTQQYFGSNGNNPITKATALVYNEPNLSPPGFTDYNLPPGAAGILTFDLGGGESLLAMLATPQGGTGNWNGLSGKGITGGTLTPVPEPSTVFLGGLGLIAFGYAARRHLFGRQN